MYVKYKNTLLDRSSTLLNCMYKSIFELYLGKFFRQCSSLKHMDILNEPVDLLTAMSECQGAADLWSVIRLACTPGIMPSEHARICIGTWLAAWQGTDRCTVARA